MEPTEKNLQVSQRIENTIEKINNNDFNIYFFTVDCKNVPNSSVEYVYRMARTLTDMGYKATILYQIQDEYTEAEIYRRKKKGKHIDENKVFVGVGEWLGEKYAELPHINISTEEWTVGPEDFLFIPEVFSSLMFEVYKNKLPCETKIIIQNYNYMTEFIPIGIEWKNYGMYSAIATTKQQSELVKRVFPYVESEIIPPCIDDCFRKPIKPKDLIVNVITKDPNDINRIIKPFFWQYPMYKFITFRDLRNYPQEEYAELLKESIITVWVDRDTSFGHAPLEAMRCGNIVVGKIPENIPEWMQDEEGIINNGLWVYNINDIPSVLAKAIASWMTDNVPQELIDSMEMTNKKYTVDEWKHNVKETFVKMFAKRTETLKMFKEQINN